MRLHRPLDAAAGDRRGVPIRLRPYRVRRIDEQFLVVDGLGLVSMFSSASRSARSDGGRSPATQDVSG
jgi:hypothetical protein